MASEIGSGRFGKYLRKHWKIYFLFVFLAYILIFLALLIPYLSKLLIDNAYIGKDLNQFWILVGVIGLAFFVQIALSIIKDFLEQHITREIIFDLTKDLFNHLQTLQLSFFKKETTGSLVYKIHEDVQVVSKFIFQFTTKVLTLIPELFSRFAIIFYLNWQFAVVIAGLSLVSYIHPYIFAKRLTKMQQNMTSKSQNIFSKLYEVLNNQQLITSFGKVDHEVKEYSSNLNKNKQYEVKKQRLTNLSQFSNNLLNMALIGIISVYAGYQVVIGSMTLGSLTAILLYSGQLLPLFRSLGDVYQDVKINSVHRGRLTHLFNKLPSIEDSPDSIDYDIKNSEIVLKGVDFSYSKDVPVFKNLNLEIPKKSKIAIVGGSGCGKSTLFSLMLRLYEPQKGEILIDNKNINKIKLNSLKKQIGISLQDSLLWHDTIKNNLDYGSVGKNRDYKRAAKLAEIDSFIESLENKYETNLAENASTLSEGQKQRLALARAFIKRPRILLLDEAMSNLDSNTEEKILKNILREFKNSTIILTSHRLSSIKKMDLIYFIDDSKKVHVGTHKQLLKNKWYRRLFGGQIN